MECLFNGFVETQHRTLLGNFPPQIPVFSVLGIQIGQNLISPTEIISPFIEAEQEITIFKGEHYQVKTAKSRYGEWVSESATLPAVEPERVSTREDTSCLQLPI
jgi:hypothetical protein